MTASLKPEKPRMGTRRQPEVSRKAILQAALEEFAQEGLSGARMDAIADAARVNKALLYYYFRDKDTLYGAVLDEFFSGFLERLTVVLDRPASAGERFLLYVRAHFDVVAKSPHYARIFVGEIMSAGRGGSPHIERMYVQYLQPIASRVLAVLHEGITVGNSAQSSRCNSCLPPWAALFITLQLPHCFANFGLAIFFLRRPFSSGGRCPGLRRRRPVRQS